MDGEDAAVREDGRDVVDRGFVVGGGGGSVGDGVAGDRRPPAFRVGCHCVVSSRGREAIVIETVSSACGTVMTEVGCDGRMVLLCRVARCPLSRETESCREINSGGKESCMRRGGEESA